jgi:5-methylcytosine-specific restriction endonuclease McrA
MEEQDYKCAGALCGQRKMRHTDEIDHIIPLHAGGTNNYNNYQILCRDCHAVKTREEIIRESE